MPTIRQLPPSLVNKIAAGEVIERPASVVKELLENSIDAGASRIELAIESGGLELIRISDNGCGIAESELPLAIASHATSKLASADDLFDVHTLGFRGEALASIAEVSQLLLRSRTADQQGGAELIVNGGEVQPVRPAGAPVGTVIEVRNLFFNTPVRRKFLRSASTETSHVSEAFTRIALAYPHVHMMLVSGQRTLFDLNPTEHWHERIRTFFGDEIADALIPVENIQDQIKLSGYATDPSVSRSNNRLQYLFLNGRHIRDRSLQHALSEAYRGLMMVGRFPVCFLRLEMPAQLVDVNVHPTKLEVRFQEGGRIYSQLLQTLRHRFLSTDLTSRVRLPTPANSTNSQDSHAFPLSRSDQRWQDHANQISQPISTTLPSNTLTPVQGTLNLSSSPAPFRPFPDFSRSPGLASNLTTSAVRPAAPGGMLSAPGLETTVDRSGFDTPYDGENEAQRRDAQMPDSASDEQTGPRGSGGEILRVDAPHQHPAMTHLGMQIHNRYLVTQDERGMIVVDQHALHERILYEQLREKLAGGQLESQQLLVPEPIKLPPAELAVAVESRELLAQIGIGIEPFGGDTILMTSYPAMLANLRPAELLRQVIEPLLSGGKEPSARDLLDELLHMIACKAAIKAGDKLAPEEITALLEQRYHYQDTHHCPHGRPTALFFSREQLDKMFKRT